MAMGLTTGLWISAQVRLCDRRNIEAYVARRGAPNSPDELHGHDCLRLARRHHLIDRWRFTKDGSDFEVHVAGHLSSGDGSVLRSWALSGEGISWEAYWDVADDLTAGRLTELLPEYRC